MLKPFGEDIWLADGPLVGVAGFQYPTRMAVIRLEDGGLFIWSPTAISPDLRAAVDALGAVKHIVAPNSLHHLALSDWKAAYPAARLYAPPGLRAKRPDLAFDADLTDDPPPDWADQIDQVLVRGNLITTEVVFFHRPSGTAIFTDLIQHFPPGWFTGWRALIAKLDLMTAPQPEVPNKFRNAFTGRAAARAALRRILAWPTRRVIMAHAPPVEADGQAFIARTFRWLKP
ncbi:DUF4336 domain-containing protein [Phenylobacterium aquaticum]|uniref:DUF4336 domain-containing protein n=1 Tax=Phenylobacterium aquaticum TaxID=1763816 RepID=UPI001F5D0F84|nr:DUF4336 domain-containing protein [Phenylobacterium aquaticum]MCI3135222.1 DUF4336 domain-containing protein [Phenylobacterium aquaticum]